MVVGGDTNLTKTGHIRPQPTGVNRKQPRIGYRLLLRSCMHALAWQTASHGWVQTSSDTFHLWSFVVFVCFVLFLFCIGFIGYAWTMGGCKSMVFLASPITATLLECCSWFQNSNWAVKAEVDVWQKSGEPCKIHSQQNRASVRKYKNSRTSSYSCTIIVHHSPIVLKEANSKSRIKKLEELNQGHQEFGQQSWPSTLKLF